MNKTTTTYFAYGALALAIVVWSVVAYFFVRIQNERAAYVQDRADLASQTDRVAAGARLHAFVVSNTGRAASLDTILTPDISALIETVKSVGLATGAPVTISDALPISAPKNKTDAQAISFVIESTGNFSSVMHTLALLDTLPTPSSIDTVEVEQETNKTGAAAPRSWHLTVKLRMLTTVPVSS